MRTYTKHPIDDKEIVFPVAKYLASIGDTVLLYSLYCDPGIEITLVTVNANGDYVLTVAGGVNGTQYNVGISIITSGQSEKFFQCRVRVQGEISTMQETDAVLDPQIIEDDGVSSLIIDGGLE